MLALVSVSSWAVSSVALGSSSGCLEPGGILGTVLWGGSGLPGEEEAADGGLTGSLCSSVLLALWAELGVLSPDTDIASWEMAVGTQDPLSLAHPCRYHRGSRKGNEGLVWFRAQC